MKKISLVIPIFNSASILPQSLKKISNFFSGKDYLGEIIFIDDGSKDDVRTIIKEFKDHSNLPIRLLFHENNLGKGAAVKTGVWGSSPKSDFIFFTDDDLPYGLPIIEEMYQKFLLDSNLEVLVGDRTQYLQRRLYPRYRQLGSQLFSLLLPAKIRDKFPDTQCGLKGFRTHIAREIFSKVRIRRWAFDSEIILIAVNSRLKMDKIAVRFLEHVRASRFSIHQIFGVGREILILRINDLRGYYFISG